jgi:hypothetical protein
VISLVNRRIHIDKEHWYELRNMHDSDDMFLSNERGQGVSLREIDLYNLFDKYFEDNY